MSEENLEATQGLPEGEPVSEEPAIETEAPETGTEQPEQQVEEPEKPKHKPWFQARIDELTKEKHDERRAREALEAKVRQYEALTPEEKQTGTDPDAVRREAEALVQKQQFDQRCNDVYSSGAKDFPDFDEKLGAFRHLGGLPPQFLEAVTQLPDAHKVLHALGSDLDQAAHIMSLPPIPQAVALAKLSASPAPRPVSKAPPPIKPIDGSPRGEKNPDDMSIEEWMEWREKHASGT